jgi:hypothetical protein
VIALLLLLIAAILPWIVHLAPPRQRPLALVGALAVVMLFGIFVQNPLFAWEFWVGMVAGIVSVVGLSAAGSGGGRRGGRGARPARREFRGYDDGAPTGEI